MAYKHQADCYRTFDGVRWPNLCDILDAEMDADVRARRKAGQRIKVRQHPEGYLQAFIHPDDLVVPA